MPGEPVLVVSATAIQQISEIYQHVAANGGIAVADRIYNEMRSMIEDLPIMPERHASRDHIRPHYRRALVSRWAIYYRFAPPRETIEVVAVLDGAMDVERHLPPE